MYLDTLANIMGHKKRYESTSPEKEVYGNFNPLLLNALVVQLSEIDKSNTLGHIGHLKSLITAPSITINDKHKSPVVIPSLHRYVVVTNNEDPVTQESGQELVAQNLLGPVCPVPLTVRGTRKVMSQDVGHHKINLSFICML